LAPDETEGTRREPSRVQLAVRMALLALVAAGLVWLLFSLSAWD
jgi:hypothetical protein